MRAGGAFVPVMNDKFRTALEEELKIVAERTGYGQVTVVLREGRAVLLETTISRMPQREIDAEEDEAPLARAPLPYGA